MALLSIITCDVCGEEKSVSHSANRGAPRICDDCDSKQRQSEKDKELNALKNKSLEERLTLVEAWIYDRRHEDIPYYDVPIGTDG